MQTMKKYQKLMWTEFIFEEVSGIQIYKLEVCNCWTLHILWHAFAEKKTGKEENCVWKYLHFGPR